MRCSLSTLQLYLQKKISIDDLHQWVDRIGIEIEKISVPTFTFSDVIIAEVISTTAHPNADSLCIATVFDGHVERQIVCGASNCRMGIRVACAIPGAILDIGKDPFKIKKSKLRGIESCGMLCSHEELGLSADLYGVVGGIMELPSDAILGKKVESLFSDPIIEFALTPNLSHCNSFLGLAREISLFADNELVKPSFLLDEETSASNLVIEANPFVVSNYVYRLITNVSLTKTPESYVVALENAGLKSINIIADITNFVMLETGHPLHAFDADKVTDHKIFIRLSLEGESFTSINGKLVTLPEGLPVISDSTKILALAGVIGSADSMITENTRNVLLETAVFPARLIRQSSKKTNISTDASYRYVRNVDAKDSLFVSERAASLIAQHTNGKIETASTYQDYKPLEWTVSCRVSRLNKILGTSLTNLEVISHLNDAGFSIIDEPTDTLHVSVPSYRHDVAIEADLIEEVLRRITLNNLPTGNPYPSTHYTIPEDKNILVKRKLRSLLLEERLQEIYTCDLIQAKEEQILQKDIILGETIPLLNASHEDSMILRTSLLPCMLKTASYNICHKNNSLAIFEIGTTYLQKDKAFVETTKLGILLSGDYYQANCFNKTDSFSFFHLKGFLENIFKKMNLKSAPIFKKNDLPYLHPFSQAEIIFKNKLLGMIGEVHPLALKDYDLNVPIFFAELNCMEFSNDLLSIKKFSPINPFPASERDLTLSVKNTLPAGLILELIKKKKRKKLENVRLMGIYHSDTLRSGIKNVSLRMTYREKEGTLSAQATDEEHNAIIHSITEELKKQDFI
ncbi:Phenylalanine--tRNA ligase beta subunit [Candidatus Clavichlamydia salmonicola]|uniref:phenylalanine--tRNA ligase subunit beta n=1 Tax=Candidatus Clavichlamydia salmonicola TaxID=469812 RepID=UPI0018918DCC|nr:phenylalanine--tRNA ligase subunit beta [Candidatus Clavichlamydia salmonicola]MBF5051004.1 Phenylalanine--tRNA ligase beta subunit [Candidatus Clavichlamydia salmonicola]